MFVFYAALIAVSLYKISLKPSDGIYHKDYLSIEKTSAVKGFFVLLVFLSHFSAYVTYTSQTDILLKELLGKYVGQLMVTMFLFYSGYGIMESISKKGLAYVHTIPYKRFFHVLVEFDIAVTLFAILSYASGNGFSIGKLLYAYTGLGSFGNSNWYIFIILILYLFTFLAFEIFRKHRIAAVVTVTLLTVVFVGIIGFTKVLQRYWIDTMICFPIGMLYSLFKPYIEKYVLRGNITWWLSFLLAGVLFVVSIKFKETAFVTHELWVVLFVAVAVLVSMKISANNAVLRWFGKNLFGFYILQRIPMIAFRAVGLAEWNIYLYFVVCFAVTVIITWVFEFLMHSMWKKLDGKFLSTKSKQ